MRKKTPSFVSHQEKNVATFLFSTFLTASASRQSLVRAGRVPVSWRASALTGAKKSITIDQLVPVANTGSRMLLSDARVQIAHPKADLTDPSACWRFALSEIYLLLARARARTQARESASCMCLCSLRARASSRAHAMLDAMLDAMHLTLHTQCYGRCHRCMGRCHLFRCSCSLFGDGPCGA